ncbi:MAG: hypothetical protein HY907_07030, partial [Deltaproteobacteria bacterium]|nr:hypothetical protein [Deltaproteobacteria bacterium]
MIAPLSTLAPGPLERLAELPVVGVLFVGPTWLVGLKLAGVIVGLWIVIVLLRALAGGSERRLARDARRLVAEGRYEQAGDFHVIHGNLQAAIHMFEQAGAWAKAARVAETLGQDARARQFRERAAGGGPSSRGAPSPARPAPAAAPAAPPHASSRAPAADDRPAPPHAPAGTATPAAPPPPPPGGPP